MDITIKKIQRQSCRAILLTPQHEILLIKIAEPKGRWVGWITPGGGLNIGESKMDCLKRELKEELGYNLNVQAHQVWTRFNKFDWNDKLIEQHETFYLILTKKFSLNYKKNLTESEKLEFKELRWWPLKEIEQSLEEFVPEKLSKLLNDLIQCRELDKTVSIDI